MGTVSKMLPDTLSLLSSFLEYLQFLLLPELYPHKFFQSPGSTLVILTKARPCSTVPLAPLYCPSTPVSVPRNNYEKKPTASFSFEHAIFSCALHLPLPQVSADVTSGAGNGQQMKAQRSWSLMLPASSHTKSFLGLFHTQQETLQ